MNPHDTEIFKIKTSPPAAGGYRMGDEVAAAYNSGVEHSTEERNFCPRCGKRLGAEPHIHTCTPPQTTPEQA